MNTNSKIDEVYIFGLLSVCLFAVVMITEIGIWKEVKGWIVSILSM